jgi:hypothetical protein
VVIITSPIHRHGEVGPRIRKPQWVLRLSGQIGSDAAVTHQQSKQIVGEGVKVRVGVGVRVTIGVNEPVGVRVGVLLGV